MPTVAVKTKGGGTAEEISLSDYVFGAPRNIPLMHQAVRAELQNRRTGTQSTRTRSEVAGGGKKPWRQKGTGRARQGSVSAPHWRHGGVALGPAPRDLGHDLPKKMRRAAIRSALSAKLADGELMIVEEFPLGDAISTKAAASFLKEMGLSSKTLVILESAEEKTVKSLRNIGNVTLRVAPVVSTRDIVDGGMVVLTRAAAAKIEATWGQKEQTDADSA